MGEDFVVKELEVGEAIVKAKIWDTAGQERFRTITKSFFQRSQGILLTYDVTNSASFKKLGAWIENINNDSDLGVVKFLLANKVDLAEARAVSAEAGKDFAAKNGMEYYETSAKENKKVKEAFDGIIRKVYLVRNPSSVNSIRLSSKGKSRGAGTCC